MSSEEKFAEGILEGYLKNTITRAQMFKASVAGAAALAIPGAAMADSGNTGTSFSEPFFPTITSGTYTTEQIIDILRIAVTAEHLAVTLLVGAVKAYNGKLPPLLFSVLQGALAEEQLHADALEHGLSQVGFTPSGGQKPATLTDNFSVPDPAVLTDPKILFATLEIAESIFVGAYMAGAREFAEAGQPRLVKHAFQIGAVEAEHRTLARGGLALLGVTDNLPNNKAFETDEFLYVRDAATAMADLGFLGGCGTAVSYPGRDAAYAAAGAVGASIVQRVPNDASTSVKATGPCAMSAGPIGGAIFVAPR